VTATWVHAAALAPAALAVACTPARGRCGVVALATGLVMLVAMADVALVPGGVPALGWSAVLVACALAATAVLRSCERRAAVPGAAVPGTAAPGAAQAAVDRPAHLLHVGCLLVMAVLTAAMAGHRPGGAAAAHHHGGTDPLVAAGLLGAVAVVVAGCAVAAGARRGDGGPAARVGALAGAGSVALMAAAVVA
jgi:hypothetical protein